MTVEEVARGLRVLTVYEGSPADRGGLEPGDIITHVDGRSIAGQSSEESTTRIKGPAGSSVRLTVRTDGKARAARRSSAPRSRSRSSRPRCGAPAGARSPTCAWPASPPARTARSAGAVRQLLKQGADGVVLDLRDNGGGLLNEAVMISSIFIPDGKIVTTRGRSRPEQVYEATGGAIDSDIPVAVLVERPQRLSVGDRDRRAAGPRSGDGGRARARSARASSRRSSRWPTAARSTSRSASTSCPAGATSAAAGSSGAPACPRTCRPRTTRRRRATRRWSPRCARRREAPGRGPPPLRARGPGRGGARQARPLLDRRPVLRARSARQRRPPAQRRPRRSGAGGLARQDRARHRAARTSRAT